MRIAGMRIIIAAFAGFCFFCHVPATRAVTPQVAAGLDHGVALKYDGSLWSWGGQNYEGQLGLGHTDRQVWPARIGSENDWTAVGTGVEFSVALKSVGTLWAWGSNSSGQLGLGAADSSPHSTPVQTGTDSDWAVLAVGSDHVLALKSGGTLWAWGENGSRQLGNGSTTDSPIPVQIGTDTDWSDVAAGRMHSLALKSGGTLWGWGENGSGQVGDGTTFDRSTPRQIGSDTDWTAVFTGPDSNSSFALKSDGTLWAWGNNNFYQLGDGTTDNGLSPAQVGSDSDWILLVAGYSQALGIKAGGQLWGWGSDRYGVVGTGTGLSITTPVRIGSESDWSALAANNRLSMAMRSDGSLYTWGQWAYAGHVYRGGYTEPVQIDDETHWAAPAGGIVSSAATGSDGSLWAWGMDQNSDGRDRVIPRELAASGFSAVQGGEDYFMARGSDGSLWAWGRNSRGCLGDGSTTTRRDPVQVGSDTDWTDFSAGSTSTSLAVKSGGTLWAWGNNQYGQLGIGVEDYDSHSTPVQVGSDSDWSSVSVGGSHVLATKTDGTLWSWGWNWDGELGIGVTDYDPHPSPVQVGTDGDWMLVRAGDSYSMALKSDGTLWGWGRNYRMELGYSGAGPSAPVQVGSDTDWIVLDTANYGSHSLALKSDGSLWAWGSNNSGQIGTGDDSPGDYPVTRIGTANDWTAVAAGGDHSLAVKSDGSLWGWGEWEWGQLASGATSVDIFIPRYLMNLSVPTPPAPSWISASDSTDFENIIVQWEDVAGEDGYRLYIYDYFFAEWGSGVTIDADVTTFIDSSVFCGGTADYRVTAFGPGGESSYSPVDSGSVYPCSSPPPAPASISVSNGTVPNGVLVSWDQVAMAEGYRIVRSDISGVLKDTIGSTGPGESSILDPLPCGTGEDYFYRVEAFNRYGDSPQTSEEMGMTAACPADWNADGETDILWRNYTSGANYLWYMNGAVYTGGDPIPSVDSSWEIGGIADFNGDDKPDILWRNYDTGLNYLYYMDGVTFLGGALLPGVGDVDWRVVATADFNIDGKPDVLWRHDTSGENYLWYMDGAVSTGSVILPDVPGAEWIITGASDFNSDGRTDILWRNKVTGANYLWYMDGGSVASGAPVPGADPSWTIDGVADFNSNGKPDICWRNYSTGDDYLWYMDGAAVSAESDLPKVPDTSWHMD